MRDREHQGRLHEAGLTRDEHNLAIDQTAAHAIAGTKVNKDHGREAIEILAFAPAILAVAEWWSQVQRFKKELQSGEFVVPEQNDRIDRSKETPSYTVL
jgi:hypothetical protein